MSDPALSDTEPPETPDEWDPEPGKRVWYENAQTGDRGWLVRRDGKDAIRLDRGTLEELRPMRSDEWRQVQNYRPLNRHAITTVAFAADKALNLVLGDHEKSRTEWASLSQAKRKAWMNVGPTDPAIRAELYAAIMKVLSPLAE